MGMNHHMPDLCCLSYSLSHTIIVYTVFISITHFNGWPKKRLPKEKSVIAPIFEADLIIFWNVIFIPMFSFFLAVVEYPIAQHGHLRFYLAPKIEEDNE